VSNAHASHRNLAVRTQNPNRQQALNDAVHSCTRGAGRRRRAWIR